MDKYWNTIGSIAKVFSAIPYRSFFVDGANGGSACSCETPAQAGTTLIQGYPHLITGKGDTLVVVSNGLTTGTARHDATLDIAKNFCRIVGHCPPSSISPRSRIAPTSTTAAFTPFLTISGKGNYFENLLFWAGFTTGQAAQINVLLSGANNVFKNCHFAGIADALSSNSTTSRSLKITGSENEFYDCTIGVDTIARTAANAQIEFASGAGRNKFVNCAFPHYSATIQTALALYGAAASCIDRYNEFINCTFAAGTGLVQTALATLPASAGGILLFKDCMLARVTGYGSDATTRGQIYVVGDIGTAGTSGISVTPTA
jgi:hypothetical protein